MPETKIYFAHHLLRARDWQERPEYQGLCNWWREIGEGVCALVGIGGAGKTAIVERFLRVLPDILPPTPDIPKNEDLPTPNGLFVFSFYDAPNPDSFFAELGAWLTGKLGDETAKPLSYQQVLILLSKVGSCLLVLDGLEKVQDTGARSVLGLIQDGRLRDFVLRIALGYHPGVSTIITTRFPLAELEFERPPLYRTIPIEEISDEVSIKLLRRRGVTGSDVELQRTVRECGNHALTVDLVGGYIADLGGDTKLKLGTSAQLKKARDKERDPKRRRVLEQEYKFARVAERYREALGKKDPAALALLERVCLFRLGIDVKTLTKIFTGKGKAEISGPALARLNKRVLQEKLDWLVEMRLLEAEKKTIAEKKTQVSYTIHPAVRDGFLDNLDPDTAKRGHEAAREGLEASLGKKPGRNPSDPAILDLLEEIIYHTLEAGNASEAFDIYWNRIGGYSNLAWRLGVYERGERICRAFNGNQPPQKISLPIELSERDQSKLITGWALYMINLGSIHAAAQLYERVIAAARSREEWKTLSRVNQNLSELWALAGVLKRSKQAAVEALALANRIDNAWEKCNSYAYLANTCALMGDTDTALRNFDSALPWQHKHEDDQNRPLYSNIGVWQAQFLARVDQNEEATQLTKTNDRICREMMGTATNMAFGDCNLLLSDLARRRGEFAKARDLLTQAHEWAIARDAKEALCWSALVRGRIAFAESRRKKKIRQQKRGELLTEAKASIEDGLRIARDCGFGIFHIDLMLLRAQIALHEGNAVAATEDIQIALNEGIHPPKESGLPELLAATDKECGYAWGVAEGRHLLAEAYLLEAAQKIGKAEFAPANENKLPKDVKKLIKDARMELKKCLALRERIQDPKVAATEEIVEQLDGGVLTVHLLKPKHIPPQPKSKKVPKGKKQMAKYDVFLCHNSNDKPTVRKLGEELKKRGFKVWLDEWELVPGRTWQEALEEIVKTTKTAAVLIGKDGIGPWQDREMRGCLSEFVDRDLPVIPVLLPGASQKPPLPLFLKQFTWVDLRQGLTKEGIDKIEWGITGKKP